MNSFDVSTRLKKTFRFHWDQADDDSSCNPHLANDDATLLLGGLKFRASLVAFPNDPS